MTNKDPWGRTPEEQFRDAKARVACLEQERLKPETLTGAIHEVALFCARLHLATLRQLTLPGIE